MTANVAVPIEMALFVSLGMMFVAIVLYVVGSVLVGALPQVPMRVKLPCIGSLYQRLVIVHLTRGRITFRQRRV